MSASYKSIQAEELEVLEAIYGSEWTEEGPHKYHLKIEALKREATLTVVMAPGYPHESPPQLELSAPWMDSTQKAKIFAYLKEYSWQHLGETIIYQCAEYIRDQLYNTAAKFSNKFVTQSSKVRAEEAEVLASIYGEDWITESENSYSVKIVENSLEVILYITMTPGYPAESPPKFELSAPWMDRKVKAKLYTDLEEVYQQNIGESIIYQWVEKIRELLQKMATTKPVDPVDKAVENLNISKVTINCPEILHGQVISDRKSTFQGHTAQVHSVEDVNAVLDKLKENKKILNATHNMYAYRIEKQTKNGVTMIQDCDDDGESHAGSRMLHLMQILEQKNVVVVVSRWYGGIQLGPDRFRHINNATRQVLDQAGFIVKK